MNTPLVLGIDVRAHEAHILVAEITGRVVASAQQTFGRETRIDLPSSYREQDPLGWWSVTLACLRHVVAQLSKQGRTVEEIIAGAVDSMAGTVVPLDADNRPLYPALMCNDTRTHAEVDEVNSASAALRHKLGFHFDTSFALPKILWLARHQPAVWEKTKHIVSAADYIVGKLTGVFDVSDPSHAFKSGFDLIDFRWSPFIERDLKIDVQRLPRVIRTGERVANIAKKSAEETGLSETTLIVAGTIDELADQIASGARHVGDWNSFLGNKLIFKGVSKHLLKDPLERLNCHLHPLGYWMPRGTSHVGMSILDARFPNVNKAKFDHAALSLSPTSLVVCPLAQKGDRFPFDKSNAAGFIQGKARNNREFYAAHLEGIAYVERLGYEVLRSLGAEMRERVYTTGAETSSPEWMQIRADIMGVELARAENANAAMGSAIIAASRTQFEDITEGTAQMVRIDRVISPRTAMVPRYEEAYQRFLSACHRRGYL